MIIASLLLGLLALGKTALLAQTTTSSNSAWVGLENALQPQTVVNYLHQPILIEQDLAADQYFQDALHAFDNKDDQKTANLIRKGAQELLKESPEDTHNTQRKLVEQRVGELYKLSFQVESGLVNDRDVLQGHFADADESLAHRYYESTHTLIGLMPEAFADRLMGLSVHLRNSKEYHTPAEKPIVTKAAEDAAHLAGDIRKMKAGERELTPDLKIRLDKLMADIRALKLDE